MTEIKIYLDNQKPSLADVERIRLLIEKLTPGEAVILSSTESPFEKEYCIAAGVAGYLKKKGYVVYSLPSRIEDNADRG